MEGLEGEQLKVGLRAAVKEKGGNILVVRILYEFRAERRLANAFNDGHTALSFFHIELCVIDQFW